MAVAITILAVIVALTVVGILVTPTLGNEITTTFTNLPTQLEAASQQVVVTQNIANRWLAEQGAPIQLQLAPGPALDSAAQQLMGSSANSMGAVNGVTGAAGRLGMMLLLSVFFLFGGSQLGEQFVSMFSGRARSDVCFVLGAVHDSFEGFARAQLLQAVLFTVGVWACLEVAHVEIAPLVAVIAGVMLLVPMVGAALAIAVPVLATVLWNPQAVLAVAGVLVVLEQLVLNVIGPRLMSRQLGLPPLLVLFGILAGGQIGGFWGAVFGIPVLATMLTCFDHFRSRWALQEH